MATEVKIKELSMNDLVFGWKQTSTESFVEIWDYAWKTLLHIYRESLLKKMNLVSLTITTSRKRKNNVADQTANMRSLIYAIGFRMYTAQHKKVFSRGGWNKNGFSSSSVITGASYWILCKLSTTWSIVSNCWHRSCWVHGDSHIISVYKIMHNTWTV